MDSTLAGLLGAIDLGDADEIVELLKLFKETPSPSCPS